MQKTLKNIEQKIKESNSKILKNLEHGFNALEKVLETQQNSQESQFVINNTINQQQKINLELEQKIMNLEKNSKNKSNKSYINTQEEIKRSKNQKGEGKPNFVTRRMNKKKLNINNINQYSKLLKLNYNDFEPVNQNTKIDNLNPKLIKLLEKNKYLKELFDTHHKIPKESIYEVLSNFISNKFTS